MTLVKPRLQQRNRGKTLGTMGHVDLHREPSSEVEPLPITPSSYALSRECRGQMVQLS